MMAEQLAKMTEQEFFQQLGEELRQLRLERRWNQGQLAKRTGIHRNSITRYERGADLTVSSLVIVCAALGTSAAVVLDQVFANGVKIEKEKSSR